MPFTNLSEKQRAVRESHIAAMREKFKHRRPPRLRLRQTGETKTRTHRPRVLSPSGLAHAIRIAAEMARQRPKSNLDFVEALEIAATYFDDI